MRTLLALSTAALMSLAAACQEAIATDDTSSNADGDKREALRMAGPNVLLIVTDDLGYYDIGAYGNDFVETPNLDRLAREGLLARESYASAAICSPSRVAIQTGLTPARLGITAHFSGPVTPLPSHQVIAPTNEPNLAARYNTIAEEMRRAGYTRRPHIGKWHSGNNGPIVHGYSEVYGDNGTYQLNSSYHYPFWPNINPNSDNPYAAIIRDAQPGDYLEDVLTDRALRDITQANAARQPFFVHVDYFAPHVPIDGKAELVAKYTAKRASYTGSYVLDPNYAAMIETIDDNVGRLIDSLEALGIADETLVIFTSDNGGLSSREQPPYDPFTPATNNGELREGKGFVYEGGIRVPLIVWGAGVVPGRVSTTPIVGHDLMPTIVDFVSGQVPTGVDGVSHAAEWRGGASTAAANRELYWHYPHYSNQGGRAASSFRQGNYKVVYDWGDSTAQLFNLRGDIGETMNLYSCGVELTDSLQARLFEQLRVAGAKLPTRNPNYRP